ncbi:MAG: beta-galactosidase, partial [Gammaproteobacteria bacterium]|nr:beta-galactosidase [Gammaproteobacteria bacterium]
EISEHLDWGETNRITIVVRDPTDSEPIERGKQSLSPNSIWYSAVSGIWQTVWLEPVPQTYIQSIRLMPDIDSETLTISVEVAGEVGDFQVR